MTAAVVPRALAACLVALGGCGPAEPAPVTGRAEAPRRSSAPPRVAWRDRDVAIIGLPAVADDGSTIVVTYRDPDGGRGNPNLTLLEKDREDRVLRRVEVIAANDVDRLESAEIVLRFDAASSWLEERHAAKHLVAMNPLELHPQTDAGPASATGPGVTVRWVPSTLTIDLSAAKPAAGGIPITRTTPASWLVADRPLCATCTEVCHNDAGLGGGYVDRRRRIAVIVIAYRGSDTCPEPGAQSHVVAW